jgi:peptidyl-prolyl cis-trans isomerase C
LYARSEGFLGVSFKERLIMMTQCVWTVAACAVVVSTVTGCKEEKIAGGKGPNSAPITAQALDVSSLGDYDSGAAKPPAAPAVDPAKVVARVGTFEIKQADVTQMIDRQIAQYGDQVPPQYQAQMRAEMQTRVIEGLIAQRLMRDEIARQKITISDADMNKSIEEISKRIESQGKTLEAELKRSGMDMSRLKDEIREGLQVEKILESEMGGKQPEITEADALAFYNEKKTQYFATEAKVQASHILITPEPKDDAGWAAAKKKIDGIGKELADGGDFAALAKANSSCPSKEKGGDLGSFGRGQMVPEFDAAAFTQELNVVGAPVKTEFGYHIIKVTAKTPASDVPFAEVKEKIVESLKYTAKGKAYETLIDGLKAKAKIVLID